MDTFQQPTLLHDRQGQQIALLDAGSDGIALGCDNLMVLRGPRPLLERALRNGGLDDLAGVEREQVRAYQAALAQPARALERDLDHPVITQLNVGNTLRCNMRCRYCYNELAGKPVKGSRARATMTPAVARQLVDAWLAQARDVDGLALLFIGGESALDLTGVEATIDHADTGCQERGLDLTVALYTNGLAMDRDLVRWANERDVSLVVSLDGPPALHDRHRLLADGSPTARRILDHIALLAEESTLPLRRVRTVTTEPCALLPLHRYLLDLGFNDLYVQAAYDAGGLGARDQVTDLPALTDWYAELLLAGVIIGVHPFTAMLERLSRRGGTVGNWYPCTAGLASLGVGPDGSFYLCHHFLDEPQHVLGHVSQGFPPAAVLRRSVCSVVEREPCRGCWTRHLCGGECYHRALTAGLGYFEVNTQACAMRQAYAVAALDLFTRVGARRPSSLQAMLDLAYHRPRPNPAAYAVDDLTPYLSC